MLEKQIPLSQGVVELIDSVDQFYRSLTSLFILKKKSVRICLHMGKKIIVAKSQTAILLVFIMLTCSEWWLGGLRSDCSG